MTSETSSRPNRGWFSKGESGNRKGRPAGSRAPQDPVVEVLVNPKLTVDGPGGPREMSVAEVIQWKTFQAALDGKARAIRGVTEWFIKHRQWMAKHAPKEAPQPVGWYISPDPDNADEALQLLGIACLNPARAAFGLTRAQLLLEPWAVQAALRRRRGGNRLTDKERDDARRDTRDPDSLRWPGGTDR